MTSTSTARTTAVSAPGKVLLAGGYLVLDRAYTGLVFGLSARINVVAVEISTPTSTTSTTSASAPLAEIVVDSPQFREASWHYACHMVQGGKGVKAVQLQV